MLHSTDLHNIRNHIYSNTDAMALPGVMRTSCSRSAYCRIAAEFWNCRLESHRRRQVGSIPDTRAATYATIKSCIPRLLYQNRVQFSRTYKRPWFAAVRAWEFALLIRSFYCVIFFFTSGRKEQGWDASLRRATKFSGLSRLSNGFDLVRGFQ